ncbi:putative glutamine amidotransferase [Chryseomicrobium aureum]|uniref:gamma-glutamyl-gamma-aminobutyrate hydrolase family protein n=1 Tax=Chryseomicrobium aureum TaxID=1441723 RepID=UPI00195A5495|nr:gamma-glutamyl-gamma-aminobutyrate hydrolase family protein [Chryseomicrobium aureum]MBM7705924.1 putative glutamine amidotransferase [Chryseomicrobium aureum]
MKPLIGISAEMSQNQDHFWLPFVYVETVLKYGGLPLMIPVMGDENLDELSLRLDGLFITGGEDIDPSYYNENPHLKLGKIAPEIDQMESELVKLMLELDKPYIGVCRGLHMLNIVQGGTMFQDIHAQREEKSYLHLQKGPRTYRSHEVELDLDSKIGKILGEEKFRVNSFHHQACDQVGRDLKVVARATDGIIEAMESKTHEFAFGFQWHPEEFAMAGDETSGKIFEAFMKQAIKRRKEIDDSKKRDRQ